MVIGRFIHFYNYNRPHRSLGYKIPAVAHMEQGEQHKKWKNKIYPRKEDENGKDVVSLSSQTTSSGESLCQQP